MHYLWARWMTDQLKAWIDAICERYLGENGASNNTALFQRGIYNTAPFTGRGGPGVDMRFTISNLEKKVLVVGPFRRFYNIHLHSAGTFQFQKIGSAKRKLRKPWNEHSYDVYGSLNEIHDPGEKRVSIERTYEKKRFEEFINIKWFCVTFLECSNWRKIQKIRTPLGRVKQFIHSFIHSYRTIWTDRVENSFQKKPLRMYTNFLELLKFVPFIKYISFWPVSYFFWL